MFCGAVSPCSVAGREATGIGTGWEEMEKRWRVSHIRTCWSLPAVQIRCGISAIWSKPLLLIYLNQ